MQKEIETISINNIEYVKKSELENQRAESLDGMKAVIIRAKSAGVFYGYLAEENGQTVVLKKARRMWQWFGASLSECAQSGTPDASKCKFPEAVDEIKILEVIEIINLTQKAKKSLDSVKVWKA